MLWEKKWDQFLIEKKSAQGAFEYLKQFKNRDDIHIRFANTNKIGVNPKFRYSNVFGIYTYPLKQVWNEVEEDSLPFASNMKYIHVLQENSQYNIIDPKDYTEQEYIIHLKKIQNWKKGKVFSNILIDYDDDSNDINFTLNDVKDNKNKVVAYIFKNMSIYKLENFISSWFLQKINNNEIDQIFNIKRFILHNKENIIHYGKTINKTEDLDKLKKFWNGLIKYFTRQEWKFNKIDGVLTTVLNMSKNDLISTIVNYDKKIKKQIDKDLIKHILETILFFISPSPEDGKVRGDETYNLYIDIQSLYGVNLNNFFKKNNDNSDQIILEKINKIAYNKTKLKNPFGKLWWIAWQGTSGPFEWAKLFLDIGIDACSDKTGTEILHPNEPFQAVFINPKSYKRLEVVDNFLKHDYKGEHELEEKPYPDLKEFVKILKSLVDSPYSYYNDIFNKNYNLDFFKDFFEKYYFESELFNDYSKFFIESFLKFIIFIKKQKNKKIIEIQKIIIDKLFEKKEYKLIRELEYYVDIKNYINDKFIELLKIEKDDFTKDLILRKIIYTELTSKQFLEISDIVKNNNEFYKIIDKMEINFSNIKNVFYFLKNLPLFLEISIGKTFIFLSQIIHEQNKNIKENRKLLNILNNIYKETKTKKIDNQNIINFQKNYEINILNKEIN